MLFGVQPRAALQLHAQTQGGVSGLWRFNMTHQAHFDMSWHIGLDNLDQLAVPLTPGKSAW